MALPCRHVTLLRMRIAIVGGGIGGLTVALALREFGFEAEVYEQAPELLDVGAAIAVWPNALRVLERLGLADAIHAHAGEINEIHWLDSHGFLINRVSIPSSAALHRADLQSTLLHALPAHLLKLDHSLVSLIQHSDKVVAKFANGHTIEADFLIGTDGIHSDVRAQLLGDGEPLYHGYTVWRGISAATPASIPTATAIELHGRGKRFGIGPVGGGRIGWWAAANSTIHQHQAEHAQHQLLRLFEDWYSPAVQLIEETPPHRILTTAAFDREPTRTWGNKRVTLLGDAIHPTTPNLGQGGCLAMEDAMVLARCFEKYGATEEALRKYEGCRYKRTAAITKYSRYYGTIGQSTIPLKFLFALIPEPIVQRVMRIVFDYDPTTTKV
ncbi:MAG TPA: FAD-dependent monooxygenase [Pyrinomonadaceae bacterium]|nr:FAD-dependent monooxygenase [Pyrinomonadaceae bacterium]